MEENLEEIRKNWNIYKNTISIDSQLYKNLWKDLYKKFDLEKLDCELRLFGLLKNFIENKPVYCDNTFVKENNKTFIIKGMDNYDRKLIHQLCDTIGLHHKSIVDYKNKKNLYIYLPDNWSFEFTAKNPYEQHEYYNKKENKLKNLVCDNCGCDGTETIIFGSVYIHNTYCEDCLDIVSDGDGSPLSCHKFEPLNYF